MTQNKFQIVLDVLLALNYNKGDVLKATKDFETLIKAANPEIVIDTDTVQQQITNLVKQFDKIEIAADDLENILNGIQIDFDTDEAKKAFEEIEKMFDNIGNVDLSKLENALNNVNDSDLEKIKTTLSDAFNNFDANKAKTEISELAKQYEFARADLQDMLDIEKKALIQMKIVGQDGSEEYAKLAESIKVAESQLKSMDDIASEMDGLIKVAESQLKSMDDIAAKFDALGKIGESLSAFSEKGIEARDAMLNLQGQTGATGEELEKLKGLAQDAFISGVGGSVGEATKAIGTAKQMLGDFLDDENMLIFTKQAAAIGQVFDKDVNEVIAKSRTFIGQFGLDGAKSANLVSYLMQETGNAMDDTLDTLDEYSQLAVKAGYAAEEFSGILSAGAKENLRDTDKLGDSIKETQIRLNAGDTTNALKSITSPITAQIEGIVKLGEQGTLTVKEMTQQAAEAIKTSFDAGQITAATREQLATALSGTMAEDIGGELWTKIFSQKIDTTLINEQAKKAGEDIANALGPVTTFEKLQRRFDEFSTSASQALSPLISQAGSALTAVSGIAPGFKVMSDAAEKAGGVSALLSTNMGKIGSVTKILTSSTWEFVASLLKGQIPALFATSAANATAGATATAAGAAGSAAWIAMLGPIALVIAAVAGLIAIFALIADAVHETAEEQLEAAKKQEEGLKSQTKTLEVQKKRIQSNSDLVKSYEELGNKQNKTAEEEEKFRQMQLKLAQAFPGVISTTKTFTENLAGLKEAASKGTSEIAKIDKQISELDLKLKDNKVLQLKAEVNISQENLEEDINKALLGGFNQQAARKEMQDYVKALKEAKNSDELAKISYDMQMAVFNNGSIDDEIQNKLVKDIQEMTKKQGYVIDEQSKINTEKMQKSISSAFKEGNVSDADIKAIADKYGKSVEEVGAFYDGLKAKAKNEKIGDILKASAEIKGNLDENNKVGELVEKFKKATSAVEKASIAEAIKKQAPEAVQATGSIITEEGKLVNQYEILTDKIDESTEAQKGRYSSDMQQKQAEFISTILGEKDAYQENIVEMNRLKTERDKLAATGLDTSKIDADINKLGAENQKFINDAITSIIKWEAQGNDTTAVYEELAKTLGKSPDEVKKLVEEQKEAKKQQKELNKEADKLADIFSKISSKAQEGFNNALNESLGLIIKIKEARSKGNKEEEKQLQIELNATRAKAKLFDRQNDSYEKIVESEKKLYEAGLPPYEIAKKQYDKSKQLLENKANQKTLDDEIARIAEKKEATEYDAYIKAQDSLNLLKDQKKALIDNFKLVEGKDGKLNIGISVNAENRNALNQDMLNVNQQIQKAALEMDKIKVKIATDSADVDAKIEEYERSKTLYKIELGITGAEGFDNVLFSLQKKLDIEKQSLESANKTLDNLHNKMIEEMRQATNDEQELAIQNKYSYLIVQQEKYNLELVKKTDETEKEISDTKKKSLDYRLQTVDDYYSKLQKLNDDANAESQETAEKFANTYINAFLNANDKASTQELTNIQTHEDKKLAMLDSYKEQGLLSDEDYEKRKTELLEVNELKRAKIEEEARRRALRTQALLDGEMSEKQRYSDLKNLELEKNATDKKLQVLEESTKVALDKQGTSFEKVKDLQSHYNKLEQDELINGYDAKRALEMDLIRFELNTKLSGMTENEKATLKQLTLTSDAVNEEYAVKSDLLKANIGTLTSGVTEAMTSLFAGDADAAADAVRTTFSKVFGVLVEMLNKKIDALVLQLIMDWFADPSTQLIPFWVKMGLIPATEALISGSIHALADPIMNNLLSFNTGGQIDQPTLALIGDASVNGMPNTEWVMNNKNMQQFAALTASMSGTDTANEIRQLRKELAGQKLYAELKGQDINISLRRTQYDNSKRSR